MIITITNQTFLEKPVPGYKLFYITMDISKFTQAKVAHIISQYLRKVEYVNLVLPMVFAEEKDPQELRFGLSVFGNIVPLDMLFFVSRSEHNVRVTIQNIILKHLRIDTSDPTLLPEKDYGWVLNFLKNSAERYADKVIEFIKNKKNNLFSKEKVKRTYWLLEEITSRVSSEYLLSEFTSFLSEEDIYGKKPDND